MDEEKKVLTQLSSRFNSLSFKDVLDKYRENERNLELTHSTSKDAISDSISQVLRKNKQTESEIERLQLLQSKNFNAFSKKSGERIKLSRKIIELEQENEEMESKLKEMEEEINRMEEEVKMLSRPSLDELYYEVIRGFGVEFVERDQKTIARVTNVRKNDVFTIECTGHNPSEVCDKIWASME